MFELDINRKLTVQSIVQVTDYVNFNLFQMNVKYDYDLLSIINEISEYNHPKHQALNDQRVSAAIFREAVGIPGRIEFNSFGCTAFKMVDESGGVRMGRNYDFKNDTSCMLVKCHPKNKFSSVAFAALDNIKANYLENEYERYACLTAPFICLDGVNSAGVSVAVLTLDSEPIFEHDGIKSTITTTLAIRAVLDEARDAAQAVEILRGFNMYATGDRDYHFFILDAEGKCYVVEYIYDEFGTRKFYASNSIETYGRKENLQCVTNFFINDIDKVVSGKKNGIYGHGKDRYNTVLDIIDQYSGSCNNQASWEVLKASSQLSGDDVTSNSQWSVVYDNIRASNVCPDFNSTAESALKRDFRNKWIYDSARGLKKS